MRTMEQTELIVETRGRGNYEITSQVSLAVAAADLDVGLCHLFIAHTSASLMVCENADPDVLRDMETFMRDVAPDGDPRFVHTAEGPDDMPAHVRTMLTRTSETFLVSGGQLQLGTWQAIYLFEHRTAPHVRRLGIRVG
jgi:secondary thiamine-phosphate synthase enzyme